ncbi:hypothetical protein FBALC1_07383 [Flavobacteriales bacterium ALC-1]|nr:hypothetical protein FBALC1_07383 [Flavobacteriales bacterium ALC-1]
MKYTCLLLLFFISEFCFAQEDNWITSEGVITNIAYHTGKRARETATIKYKLENGKEQLGNAELFRVPFIGSLKSVGDTISINYKKSNPVLLETRSGNILSQYGMYALIILGLIFSIKPFMNKNKAS